MGRSGRAPSPGCFAGGGSDRSVVHDMCRRSRTLRSALLLPGLLVVLAAAAAPVLQAEETTTPAQPGLPTLGSTAPATPSLPDSGAAPAADSDPPAAAAPASRAASTPTRPAPPRAKPSTAARAVTTDSETIDPDLKDAAKAALELANEIKEMVAPAGSEDAERAAAAASAAASGNAARTAESAEDASAEPEPNLYYVPPSQQAAQGGRGGSVEIDLVREAIRHLKELVEHPVTLMLLPLVAFGFAAMAVVQFRSQLDSRRGRRRSAHGRRAAADPVEGRPRRSSNRAAAEVQPTASPSKTEPSRSRSRLRLRAKP
jgi:hypothetical protein